MVAGGYQYTKVMDVLMEGQWVSCAPLYSYPRGGALHNGNLYFSCPDRFSVVYCQLESLVKACVQPDGVSDTGELWNFLPAPNVYREIAAYCKFLICPTSNGDLHALSPDTESWVHVGRLDIGEWGHDRLMPLCTGELAALAQEYARSSLHVNLLSVKGMYIAHMPMASVHIAAPP